MGCDGGGEAIALDPEQVCGDCRRFWHGPAGYIPYWYGVGAGGNCTNPRHAKSASLRVVQPVEKPTVVEISVEERDRIERIGHARNAAKDPSWTRRKTNVFNDAEVDALGMLGEYAVARYLEVPLDERITRGGDAGHDLVWRQLHVAVKFNHRLRGYLMVEERVGDSLSSGVLGDLKSDLIVLVYGRCYPNGTRECFCREPGTRKVVLGGWLERGEFIERAARRDWGIGGRYVCTIAQLRPMDEIWEACS